MPSILVLTARFLIRPVLRDSSADLEAVFEVYRQCEDFLALGPVATASRAMVQADLELSEREGGIFCGIFEPVSDRMLGVLDFVPSGFCGEPSVAFLELLMIAAPYRCTGLGAEVVQAAEQFICMDPRIQDIRAGVQVNNPGAIRFWQRMGYQIVSGPIDHPDGTTAFDLLKHL